MNKEDAKKVLNRLLYKILEAQDEKVKKDTEYEFNLVLKYVYKNKELKDKTRNWLNQIENKDEANLRTIVKENNEFNFYYAWPLKSNYDYGYYINNLGIVLLVKSKDKDVYKYSEDDEKNKKCWFFKINNEGCIKGELFKQEHPKLPNVKKFEPRIYEFIRDGKFKLYKNEEEKLIKKLEENKWNTETCLHHIVEIIENDKEKENEKGNDARDNRMDNIICLPKELHDKFLHHNVSLTKEEEKEAEKIYRQNLP